MSEEPKGCETTQNEAPSELLKTEEEGELAIAAQLEETDETASLPNDAKNGPEQQGNMDSDSDADTTSINDHSKHA